MTHHLVKNFVSYHLQSPKYHAFVSRLSNEHIPLPVGVALKNQKRPATMLKEIQAFKKNKTWKIVDLLAGKRSVECKWVYTLKYNLDGRWYYSMLRWCRWVYNMDYFETFSPVEKSISVRVILSLAANLDWPLFLMNVKNAFIHGPEI